jgi:hypothetical protein
MTEMMSPRWMTNCANLAERRYELRPCQRSSLVRWLNWVTEKSAARDACLPSLPTMPTPAAASVSIAFCTRDIKKKIKHRTDIGSLDHASIVMLLSFNTCFKTLPTLATKGTALWLVSILPLASKGRCPAQHFAPTKAPHPFLTSHNDDSCHGSSSASR